MTIMMVPSHLPAVIRVDRANLANGGRRGPVTGGWEEKWTRQHGKLNSWPC